MKTEHTPTPWKYEYVDRNRAVISAPKGANHVYCLFGEFVGPPDFEKQTQLVTCTISHQEAEANAAFIVRAVNSHAALVEALEAAQDELSAIVDGNPNMVDDSTLDKISAALELAKC